MKSKYFFLLPGICSAILLTGCFSSEKKEEEKKEKVATEPAAAEAITVSKGKIDYALRIPGELIAYQQVDLYAKVSCFVKKLYVDVGSFVKEGQILAVMEAPEINSQLAASESRLKSFEALYIASKANYDRLLETSKTPGTVSPNDLDIALAKQKSDFAQFQAAQSAYKEVTINRDYLTIKAPFSGVISARNVSTGAYVGPSGRGSEFPLFTLQQQNKLRLSVSVPEAYTSYITPKANVGFTVKSVPGKQFSAKVNRVAGALDTRLRSERVEMDVANDKAELLPGMIAEIKLNLPAKDSGFVVPSSAVLASTERIFVVKVNGGKADWVDVQKGREANGQLEVYGNLKIGDTLLKTANEEIRKGATVPKIKLASN